MSSPILTALEFFDKKSSILPVLFVRSGVIQVGACQGNAFFLFVDGHETPTYMHVKARDYIFCIFLRANASITDQSNDNGFNAAFKAAYSIQFSLWSQQHRCSTDGTSFTKTYQNEIISASYKQL
jgi:hypothetical protein